MSGIRSPLHQNVEENQSEGEKNKNSAGKVA